MPRQIFPYLSYFKQKLNLLLETNTKIQYILDNLVALILTNNGIPQSNNNKNVIQEKIPKIKNDVLKIFKLGILMHRCIIEICIPDNKNIIDKLIESCQRNLKGVKNNQLDENSQKFFKEKIVLPYLYYLQRRACYKVSKDVGWKKVQEILELSIDLNIENIKQQCDLQINEICYIQKNIQKSYHLINLLNKALCTNEAMLAMVRYYGERFAWTEDYSILIGMDIGYIYGRLAEGVQNICEFFQKTKEKESMSFEDERNTWNNLDILFKQIQKINEGLQIIYNTYYKQSKVSKYAPTLIDIDKYGFPSKTVCSASSQKQSNIHLNIPQDKCLKSSEQKIQKTLRQVEKITSFGSLPKKWKSETDIANKGNKNKDKAKEQNIQPQSYKQQNFKTQVQKDNKKINSGGTKTEQNIQILAELVEISKTFLEIKEPIQDTC